MYQSHTVEYHGDPMWAVAIEISNNGTTFIWSPIPLPHLAEWEDPKATPLALEQKPAESERAAHAQLGRLQQRPGVADGTP